MTRSDTSAPKADALPGCATPRTAVPLGFRPEKGNPASPVRGNGRRNTARTGNESPGIVPNRPIRIQLSRKKGWRMPENTVSVARPGKWGNPFSVLPGHPIGQRVGGARNYYAVPTVSDAIGCFREYLLHPDRDEKRLVDDLAELRGKNLACWCKPGDPCHADV